VTSAAPALAGDTTIGLALVRREIDDGSVVTATVKGTDSAAEVRSLPLHNL